MTKMQTFAAVGFVVSGFLMSGCSALGLGSDDDTSTGAGAESTGSTAGSTAADSTAVDTSTPNSSTPNSTAPETTDSDQSQSEVRVQDVLEQILITYTEAINDREPEEAFALFTEELQQRVPVEELVDGTSTSYISRVNVSQVLLENPDVSNEDSELRQAATVFASFRTDQDPSFGRDAQPCSWWEMEYRLEQIGDQWLIDSATALGGSPFPCPVVTGREPVDVTEPSVPDELQPDEPDPVPEPEPGAKPVVHLTLDDGPGPETSRYLALFDEYEVEATFFVNSNKISGRQDVTRQIVDSGHAIANHTHTHCNIKNPARPTPVSQCGNRTAQSEIGDAQDIIAATTGVTPTCFRPPFGAQSDATKAVIASFGLANWLWDIDTNDWQFNARNRNYTDAQAIAELNKASTLKPSGPSEGVVILLHDGTASAPRMLKLLRTWLEQNADEYQFKKLTGC